MEKRDLIEQINAANIPLSAAAVQEFQALWQELMGESIVLQTAVEHGRRLLALYKFVYRPMTAEQYEQLTQLICKSQEVKNDERFQEFC